MNQREIFELLASRYASKPDDFVLSIGHHELPEPSSPVGIFNLPTFVGFMSLDMKTVREFAAGMVSK